MLLFKNSAKTMEGVLNNAKHATDGKPHDVKPGDVILIAQTKSTLLPGQKPIRWIMNFVSCEEDINNLSDKIWEEHWRTTALFVFSSFRKVSLSIPSVKSCIATAADIISER